MMAALQTPNIEGEIINIGTGKTYKMKDILTLIKKETGAEEKRVMLDKNRLQPRDDENLIIDNTKARKILDWKPTTTFKEGIRKTIKWYLENGKMWGYEKHGWKWRY